jgi:hypothetical protein
MRKMIGCIALAILTFLAFILVLPHRVQAAANLDEIENYVVTVNMRTDGSMNMTYHIEWKVLDSTTEGPLEWVKIGIANQHVDEIKALSDNIRDIQYWSEGGDYIRIDFKRSYCKDEIVAFDYSFHQSYMYTLDDDAGLCRYSFTPGWFDQIAVKALTVMWNTDNVLNSDAANTAGGYLVWTTSLPAGEKYRLSVDYELGVFATSGNEQATEDTPDFMSIIMIFLGLGMAGSIIAVILRKDKYKGGFASGQGAHIGYYGTGSCVHSCACACACACAGGGRAGCAAKKFYGDLGRRPVKT